MFQKFVNDWEHVLSCNFIMGARNIETGKGHQLPQIDFSFSDDISQAKVRD
jgi:hypothetical protein